MNLLTPPRISAILAAAGLAGFGFGAVMDRYDGPAREPVSDSNEVTSGPSTPPTRATPTPMVLQQTEGPDRDDDREDADNDDRREDETSGTDPRER
jgi:hypothetical protein